MSDVSFHELDYRALIILTLICLTRFPMTITNDIATLEKNSGLMEFGPTVHQFSYAGFIHF